jgi:uncharacterized protein (TIGR02145 family)
LQLQIKQLQSLSNVIDIDGNSYKTVKIGSQIWMSENLKTSRYRNGDPIPIVTDKTAWSGLTTGARCWYDNDSITYENPYGNLYNGYAATDLRGICPIGWHVPSDTEWTILTTYLGGVIVAGGKIKSVGTAYWNVNIIEATNESGFSALPGGYRDYEGRIRSLRDAAVFWSASEIDYYNLWLRYLDNYWSDNRITRAYFRKESGAAVRCLMD